MKCDNCGSINNDHDKVCKKCGYILKVHTYTKTKTKPLKIITIVLISLILVMAIVTTYIVYFDVSEVEVLELTQNQQSDITKNTELTKNINDTNITRQLYNASRNGVPIYKIGDGSAPVTLICTGVLGDQLVPPVASMKLINYLNGRKINGTVYIIPFASPKALEENTELTNGINLNRLADEDGTISNKIVEYARTINATAVGDCHETQVGKNPGVTTIMCSKIPTPESCTLATDMSNLSLDTTLTYNVAGVSYDGAIEDELNLKGIPAVTPLVLVDSHSNVYPQAVSESYDQMLALLIVNGNLNYDDTYTRLANMDLDGFRL